jgi:hypothetical protein
MRNEVMKRIYSRQLDKRRTGNFKLNAIGKIKEETREAEKLAAEKIEDEKKKFEDEKKKAADERTMASTTNAFSNVMSESELDFNSLIGTSDLVLKA